MPEKNVGMLKPRKAKRRRGLVEERVLLDRGKTPIGMATRMLSKNAEPEIISVAGKTGQT